MTRVARASTIATLAALVGISAATAAALTPPPTPGRTPVPPRPDQPKPAAPSAQPDRQGEFADVNGARIFYQVAGEGRPLLLIHGYPLNAELFAKQREELAREFKVITLDLRGFGKSTAPDSDVSISAYAKDVVGLLDHLKIEKAIIGGHSMGGMTALELYELAPDRVAGLILIDTTAKPAPIVGEHLWRGFAAQAQEKGVESITSALVAEMLTGESRRSDQELVGTLEAMVKAASVNGAVGGGEALAKRPDNTELLSEIEVPVLILVGIEDTVTPVALSEEMKEAIPNATLKIIDGASHASIIEKPREANRAILDWAETIRF